MNELSLMKYVTFPNLWPLDLYFKFSKVYMSTIYLHKCLQLLAFYNLQFEKPIEIIFNHLDLG